MNKAGLCWRRAVVTAVMAWVGAAHAGTTYEFLDLGASGSLSRAFGINNVGQVVGASGPDNSESYHATLWNIGSGSTTLSTDMFLSTAYGVNDGGQVVGWSRSGAVTWVGDVESSLGPLANTSYGAFAINNQGQAVGTVNPGGGQLPNAALWGSNGEVLLATPLGGTSYGRGINDLGQVAGSVGSGLAGSANEVQHAAVWDGNGYTDLGTLGGKSSVAVAINNAGWAVGGSDAADGSFHAALWANGVAVDLGMGSRGHSSAYAINNAGVVVGEYWADDGGYHGAIWLDGVGYDLNTLLDPAAVAAGWTLGEARGINDQGWIVGVAENVFTTEQHAYLIRPSAVPEPSTASLIAMGMLGLCGAMRNRRQEVQRRAQRGDAMPTGTVTMCVVCKGPAS